MYDMNNDMTDRYRPHGPEGDGRYTVWDTVAERRIDLDVFWTLEKVQMHCDVLNRIDKRVEDYRQIFGT